MTRLRSVFEQNRQKAYSGVPKAEAQAHVPPQLADLPSASDVAHRPSRPLLHQNSGEVVVERLSLPSVTVITQLHPPKGGYMHSNT